jgi:hypothetical protein
MKQEHDRTAVLPITSVAADAAGLLAYPLMRCDETGVVRSGYEVCIHVIEGAAVMFVEVPSLFAAGTMLCSRCIFFEHNFGALVLCCAECAERDLKDHTAAA